MATAQRQASARQEAETAAWEEPAAQQLMTSTHGNNSDKGNRVGEVEGGLSGAWVERKKWGRSANKDAAYGMCVLRVLRLVQLF